MGREEQSGGSLLHKEQQEGDAEGVSLEKDRVKDRCGGGRGGGLLMK